jgi:hypothetical protein
MTHTRVWSWRRWRHECRACRLLWRGRAEKCQGQPFEERYPVRSVPAWMSAPTAAYEMPGMTVAQRWRANGGRW